MTDEQKPTLTSGDESPKPKASAPSLPPVGFWVLKEGVVPPRPATDGSFGYDLLTPYDFILPPGFSALIELGFSVELPHMLAMYILPRSGKAHRNQLWVNNSPGLIDADYRGEIMVSLHNGGSEKLSFVAGDAIAQAVFIPTYNPPFEVRKPGDTRRGSGGFGSTDGGKK